MTVVGSLQVGLELFWRRLASPSCGSRASLSASGVVFLVVFCALSSSHRPREVLKLVAPGALIPVTGAEMRRPEDPPSPYPCLR